MRAFIWNSKNKIERLVAYSDAPANAELGPNGKFSETLTCIYQDTDIFHLSPLEKSTRNSIIINGKTPKNGILYCCDQEFRDHQSGQY